MLEALFHRDTDADELGPGLPHDVAQTAHGLTARHEVIDDEDLSEALSHSLETSSVTFFL